MNTSELSPRPFLASVFAAALLATGPAACSSPSSPTGSGGSGSSTSTSSSSTGTAGCDPGYEPKDGACVDVDECKTDNGGCGDPAIFACKNAVGGPPGCEFLPAKDHAAITQGVSMIDLGGAVPSALVVYGDTAFPVAVDAENHAFIAAARVGQGKALHYGHETFIAGGLADPGVAKLLLNTIAWMAPGKAPAVGVEPGLDQLSTFLGQHGFTVKTTPPSDLAGIDVYCMTSYNDYPDADVQNIGAFVKGGGGLVSGGLAWYWGYSHAHPAENYPGNKYLRTAGIGVTTSTSDGGVQPISPVALSDLLHAKKALSRFVDHVSGGAQLSFTDQNTAADTVDFAIDFLPLSFTEYFTEADVLKGKVGPVVPTGAKPLSAKDHPIERTVVHIDHKYADESPPDAVKEHPAASDFPGLVPAGAAPISRAITVDGSYVGRDPRFAFAGPGEPVWRSTGLYAPAGKKIHVKIDAAAAGKGLDLLLGAHTDTLWDLDTWPRFPALPRAYPIDAPEIDAASAFGGLVYVRVPVGSALGPVTVTIDGAVGAPLFQKGKTTASAWKTVERMQPGPWAEIATDKLSITVPSTAIAALDDPTAVLDLWDQVLDADADLAAIPHARPRAERILTDREISAGYMHSGYPIMTHLDVADDLVSQSSLQAGFWGPLHEIGHNHQWDPHTC
jgi:Peptidase M60, enhancin and enhancin-like/N-terminal domain of M60-like peptidases